MKVSYNWLNDYFQNQLPSVEIIVDLLINHAFEVESVEPYEDDFILELDILPDRNHDCLGHRGVAREIGALVNRRPIFSIDDSLLIDDKQKILVDVKEPRLCRRYLARRVTGIKGGNFNQLAKRLSAVGQKPKNSIVDLSNYAMFDTSQPLHVFDADLVKGNLVVRLARKGESIKTLDEQIIDLDNSILIIADNEGPLAIAGVKGGARARVSDKTINLIIESANFEPVNIRKTANRLNLRTDAVKRYENDLSPSLTMIGLKVLSLLLNNQLLSKPSFGPVFDFYPKPEEIRHISVSISDIENKLGTEVDVATVKNIFSRLDFTVSEDDEKITVSPPPDRLDINIKEDLIREVGRVIGYSKIKGCLPDRPTDKVPMIDKSFALTSKIKEILIKTGFSEIYSYTFAPTGDVAIAKPLSADKAFLRTDLTSNLKEKLEQNLKNTLFDHELIKLFEIGSVFPADSEDLRLAVGFSQVAIKGFKPDELYHQVMADLATGLAIEPAELEKTKQNSVVGNNFRVIEFSLSQLNNIRQSWPKANLSAWSKKEIKYQPFSIFPSIKRDIALFVPPSVTADDIISVIKQNAGPLLVSGPILFDRFDKGDKISYAFRIVFQSFDRTLSDDEANQEMIKITVALEKNPTWEVRK